MASSEPLLPRDEGSNGGQQTIAVSLASIVPSADSGERDDDQRQPGNIEFLGQLKGGGVVALLHVKVGVLEPATVRFDKLKNKLVIETNRKGWGAICYCHDRRYEIGPGQLKPMGRMLHTKKLRMSMSVINPGKTWTLSAVSSEWGGQAKLVEGMKERSLSLVRPLPVPDAIDLTFVTPGAAESLREWAHERLPIDSRATNSGVLRVSKGNSLGYASDELDPQKSATENQPMRLDQVDDERGEKKSAEKRRGEMESETRKVESPPPLAKAAAVYPASMRRSSSRGSGSPVSPGKRRSARPVLMSSSRPHFNAGDGTAAGDVSRNNMSRGRFDDRRDDSATYNARCSDTRLSDFIGKSRDDGGGDGAIVAEPKEDELEQGGSNEN